jgi:hypothetical protein
MPTHFVNIDAGPLLHSYRLGPSCYSNASRSQKCWSQRYYTATHLAQCLSLPLASLLASQCPRLYLFFWALIAVLQDSKDDFYFPRFWCGFMHSTTSFSRARGTRTSIVKAGSNYQMFHSFWATLPRFRQFPFSSVMKFPCTEPQAPLSQLSQRAHRLLSRIGRQRGHEMLHSLTPQSKKFRSIVISIALPPNSAVV